MEDKHTPGPWMVLISRDNEGITGFRPVNHTHTAIALGNEYWLHGDKPTPDENGYNQPNDMADICDFLIHTARLIAAAPELLEALKKAVDRQGFTNQELIEAREVIAKAEPAEATG